MLRYDAVLVLFCAAVLNKLHHTFSEI